MGLETAALVATIVAAAATVGTTAYTLSKGTPSLPEVPRPENPPAPPPPPGEAPPPPSETEAGQGVATAKRKRSLQYGVRETLLTSPTSSLGNASPGTSQARTLLGG